MQRAEWVRFCVVGDPGSVGRAGEKHRIDLTGDADQASVAVVSGVVYLDACALEVAEHPVSDTPRGVQEIGGNMPTSR